MNRRTLEILIKLRKFQLEQEQWKLHEMNVKEYQASQDVKESARLLHDCYGQDDSMRQVGQTVHHRGYVKEASIGHDMSLRKLSLAQRETVEQVLKTMRYQQRHDMMTRLEQHAIASERLEQDIQERRFLDDLAHGSYIRQEREGA
jgi:hypothetical protein